MNRKDEFKMDKENGGEGKVSGPAAVLQPVDPPAPASGEDSEVKWDTLADDLDESDEDFLDDEGEEGGEPKLEEEAPPAPSAPAAAPPAPPTPGATAAATPAETPPATPPVVKTAEQVSQEQEAARVAIRDNLRNMYAAELSDDDKAALMTSPETVMPQMMARAALDGAQLAMAHMQHMLPTMLEAHLQRNKGVDAAWGEFYAGNQDLNKPEYRPAIEAALRGVKAMGRKLSKEEAIATVGRYAREMLNLPAQGAGSPPANTPAASAPSGAAPVAPFVPVARGRATATPTKPAKKTGWEEFLKDDED